MSEDTPQEEEISQEALEAYVPEEESDGTN